MHINKPVEINTDLNQIDIKTGEVLELLGYNIDAPDPHVTDRIEYLIKTAYKKIEPTAGFIILKKNSHTKIEIKLRDTVFNINNLLSSNVKNAEFIALFMCSIGNTIEKESSELMDKNEMLDGYIMNLIGSVSAESVADNLHNHLRLVAENEGLNITNRYSPGYCNWDVNEQFKLFSFFPPHFCNITLTDSALMSPVKSVSGMIGIGKDVKYRSYLCDSCNDVNCIYRKIRKQ